MSPSTSTGETGTGLIRWNENGVGSITGYAGTLEPWLFQIYRPGSAPDNGLALMSQLPGLSGHLAEGTEDELKRSAEMLLREFADRLGAARWKRLRSYLDGKIAEGEPAPEFRQLAGQHAAYLEIRARMDDIEAPG